MDKEIIKLEKKLSQSELNTLIKKHSKSIKKNKETIKIAEFSKLKLKHLSSMTEKWKKLRKEIKIGEKFKKLLEEVRKDKHAGESL